MSVFDTQFGTLPWFSYVGALARQFYLRVEHLGKLLCQFSWQVLDVGTLANHLSQRCKKRRGVVVIGVDGQTRTQGGSTRSTVG